MKLVQKLDEKYFVVKQDDLDEALNNTELKELFKSIIYEIESIRKKKNKIIYPSYLVLNLNDNFNIQYLQNKLEILLQKSDYKLNCAKIKDIAIDLVNSILINK